jgi:hypothetical protein
VGGLEDPGVGRSLIGRAGRPPGFICWRMHTLALVAAASWLAAEPEGQLREEGRPWTLQADLGATLVQRRASSSTHWRLANASILGASFGRRWDWFDAFVRAEADHWSQEREDGSRDHVLALNVGPGLGFTYARERVRSSLAAGLSVLALPTDIDRAGSVGLFFDLRPVTLRWPLDARTWIGVCPLSLALTVPVLTGIPLLQLEYRTTIQAERAF